MDDIVMPCPHCKVDLFLSKNFTSPYANCYKCGKKIDIQKLVQQNLPPPIPDNGKRKILMWTEKEQAVQSQAKSVPEVSQVYEGILQEKGNSREIIELDKKGQTFKEREAEWNRLAGKQKPSTPPLSDRFNEKSNDIRVSPNTDIYTPSKDFSEAFAKQMQDKHANVGKPMVAPVEEAPKADIPPTNDPNKQIMIALWGEMVKKEENQKPSTPPLSVVAEKEQAVQSQAKSLPEVSQAYDDIPQEKGNSREIIELDKKGQTFEERIAEWNKLAGKQKPSTPPPTLEGFGLKTSFYEDCKSQEATLIRASNDNIKIIDSTEIGKLISVFVSTFFVVFYFFALFGCPLYLFHYDSRDSIAIQVFAGIWGVFGWVAILFLTMWLYKATRDLLTSEEHKKAKKAHVDINSQFERLKINNQKIVAPFETAYYEFYQRQLDDFYKTRLYKQRSGTEVFESSIDEFASMIESLSDANKTLLTKKFTLDHYSNYFNKRMGDHDVQKGKSNDSKSFPFAPFTKSVREKPVANTPTTPKSGTTAERVSIEKPVVKTPTPPESKYRTARKIDWETINAKRLETGLKGEEIVVEIEKEYLHSINRKDLADKIRHVSVTEGDGLGYDVLSYFSDGKEKYIEVKSAAKSLQPAFYMSSNELGFLREHQNNAFVYRIQLSNESNELRILKSIQVLEAEITPTQYRIKIDS